MVTDQADIHEARRMAVMGRLGMDYRKDASVMHSVDRKQVKLRSSKLCICTLPARRARLLLVRTSMSMVALPWSETGKLETT